MDNLKRYLLDNVSLTIHVIEQCNNWNESLEHLLVYHNDSSFFNRYFEGDAHEAVRVTYHGYYDYDSDLVWWNDGELLESLNMSDYKPILEEGIDDVVYQLLEEGKDERFINMIDIGDSKLIEIISKALNQNT